MPAISASAPGKIILLGEHAVVYERPALAAPVTQVYAKATLLADPRAPSGQVIIDAPDLALCRPLSELESDHPLRLAVEGVQQALSLSHLPAVKLRITSTIPIAAGLGSGAAVSVAIARGLSAFLGHPLPDESVSAIAYRVDQKHHGTPSGIDNTVITYAQPICFTRGKPFELIHVARPFTLVIAHTGIASPTGAVVGDLRARWQAAPHAYEPLFDEIAALVAEARQAIESGSPEKLGPLFDQNQVLLQRLEISCPELDHLIHVARQAGALGAKLSGGGRGGNLIALCAPETVESVSLALRAAGAARVLSTTVSPSNR